MEDDRFFKFFTLAVPPKGLKLSLVHQENKIIFELVVFKPLHYKRIGPFKQNCKHWGPSDLNVSLFEHGRWSRSPLHWSETNWEVRGAANDDNNMGIMFAPQKHKGNSKIR